MKKVKQGFLVISILTLAISCSRKDAQTSQPVHQDVSYKQDFSKKFDLQLEGVTLKKVFDDKTRIL